MMRRDVTKSMFVGHFAFAFALGGLSLTPSAKADESCTLRGEVSLPQSVAVYDAATGGKEFAHFTGAKVPLAVSSFPDSSSGRAVIETSGFRIKGFVRARELPVYTARSVPVYAGHVWIGEGRRVAISRRGTRPASRRTGTQLTHVRQLPGLGAVRRLHAERTPPTRLVAARWSPRIRDGP